MTEEEKRRKLEILEQRYGGKNVKVTVTVQEKVPPIRPTIELTNPNRPENEFMMALIVLRNALAKYGPACRERAKRAGKWVWRDMRILLRLVEKVQNQMLATMPPARERYYAVYCEQGHYELVMNGPKRPDRFVVISDKKLGALTDAAMEAECVMCFREGSEIGKCPLRAALLECAPPTELQEGLWTKCEYREAASQVLNGQDVEI